MRLTTPLQNLVDRSAVLNRRPFDPRTPMHPPRGRYVTMHTGIMIPDLPAPHNFLNIITVVGQPKVGIFRNPHLIKTTALDTASLLIGTSTATPEHFNGYSIRNDCDMMPDGSYLRFGNDLVLRGLYPEFSARRTGHAFNFDLNIRATDRVTHFASMVGGIYDHWSLFCEYEGHIEHAGTKTAVQGLCNYEYARAAHINLPFRLFTYQVISLDARTQLLLSEILGPFGMPVLRQVCVRSLDDGVVTYKRGLAFTVHEYEARPVVTPDGIRMRLPRRFSWRVEDDAGKEMLVLDGLANGDFKYGLGAGYAGSYGYCGCFRGKPIEGTGYIEYIDQR